MSMLILIHSTQAGATMEPGTLCLTSLVAVRGSSPWSPSLDIMEGQSLLKLDTAIFGLMYIPTEILVLVLHWPCAGMSNPARVEVADWHCSEPSTNANSTKQSQKIKERDNQSKYQ